MQTAAIGQILEFWFSARELDAPQIDSRMERWFGSDPALDQQIRDEFGPLVEEALAGRHEDWAATAEGRLALILLLDQFPRSLYRGTAEAFATDLEALRLSVSGLQLGADAVLDPVERIFFYMPMQHAESAEIQAESVAAFRRLCDEAPDDMQPLFAGVHAYAMQHRDIIAHFGRFPHRNAALGRETTPEEQAWLDAGGTRFGQ